jgi:epoxyqueuosine reductase
MVEPDPELTERLKSLAEERGFVRAGVARAEPLTVEGEHLDAWLAKGFHGEMDWMARTAEVRKNPCHPGMLGEARSVLVLAAPYLRSSAFDGAAPGRVAKYALGRDYHNVLKRRAGTLLKVIREEGYLGRLAIDSKPVFERAWAERAGLGFVGKNCCLIVPGIGSHVFLACIVTSAPLLTDEPMERRCGSCTLCLQACPTRAFEAERRLDARRCVSYLTIEHRGAIPASLRPGLGPWLFGCDVCQDVCPYNQTSAPGGEPMQAFEPAGHWDEVDPSRLLQMDQETFQRWAAGSPLKRAGHEGLRRNAAIVLGNAGGKADLPVLRTTMEGDPSALVREAAGWACAQINRRMADSAEPREPGAEAPDPGEPPS